MSLFVHLNGRLLHEKDACISPFDHGFLYGDGIYETLRTIHGRIFDFEAHAKRLRRSAEIMDIPIPWTNTELKEWTQETAEKNRKVQQNISGVGIYRGVSKKEMRIRITVARGKNGFSFLGAKSPTLLISATELADYSQYKSGISLVAIEMSRMLPEVKSTSLLPLILAKQAAQKANVFECLFLNDKGFVTECSTSNVFYRNEKTIFVAPQKDVLLGTMQRIFLQKAKRSGFLVAEKDSSLEEFQKAEEVIITNSLFGALPVQDICGQKMKTCPGELYKKCPIDFSKDILVKYE